MTSDLKGVMMSTEQIEENDWISVHGGRKYVIH